MNMMDDDKFTEGVKNLITLERRAFNRGYWCGFGFSILVVLIAHFLWRVFS